MTELAKDQQLGELLEKHELKPSKWIPLFHKEHIYKPDQILAIKGSRPHYLTLSSKATDRKEQSALMKLLDITEATDNPDIKLEIQFSEVGLEPKYWLQIFKHEIGVTSVHALANVGEESFGMLQQFVQNAWEKKALRKLLGMGDERTSFKAQREKKREKIQQRQKESEQMLQQLKELQRNGKKRHDNAVQEVESRIREALEISPDAWIPNDANLKMTIHDLEKSIGQLDEILRSRQELSDIQLLQNASGGLALQGIFVSTNVDDQTKTRDRLLKLADDIQLMGPSLSNCLKEEAFSSQHQEDQFRKSMDKLGYSASTSAKGGFWGGSVEVGGSYGNTSESEMTTEHHQKELYSSVVKYYFIPLASTYFSDSQLLLSDEAMKKLKVLERLVKSSAKASDVQDECKRIFDKFGSHANRGHLHFGGIYWSKSVSRGFEQKQMETVKKLQREVVNMKATVSYGSVIGGSAEANHSKINATLSGKFSSDVIGMTALEVSTTGGPPEISNLSQWKSGMAASNSTWSLIDRGISTVPVWDIIQMNHRKDFQDPDLMVKTLHQAWKEITKLCTDSSTTEQLIQEEEEMEQAMGIIKIWNEEQDKTNYARYLNELLCVKQDLVSKSMSLQVWPERYLSQPPVQKFLRLVMKAKCDTSSKDTEYIKLLMKQLVKPSDVHIAKGLTDVSDWLYCTDTSESVVLLECTNLENLKMLVEENLNKMILAKAESILLYEQTPEQHQLKIQATVILTQAVNYLRICFRDAKQKYEELFLLTILFPCKYDVAQSNFQYLLSIGDLEYLQKELEHSKEFSNDSLIKVQASIFCLTVKMYHREDVDVTEAQIKLHLEYLQKEMKGILDPHVEKVFVQFRLSKYDWKDFHLELASLQKGIVKIMEQGSQLVDILSKPEASKSPLNSKIDPTPCTLAKPSGIVRELFNKLDLLKFYPQQLKLQHALLIRHETLGNKPCSKTELLPYFILQKLMMNDYLCRGVLLQEKQTPSTTHALTKPQQHDDFDDFDDFDDNPDALVSSSDTLSTVHPMDGLLALLHCSDNFLRQTLITRLTACQLAIPFLLPDPTTGTLLLPLWAMRTIHKEWKFKDTATGKIEPGGCRIVNHPAPIISFYRLTSHRSELSKSRLLNEVISDSPHNYFFHFHCDGGSTKPILTDGLIELCWYLPGGKPNDPFKQVIAFTNLRGDALNHPTQTKFLSQVSFMNIVLLTEKELNEEHIKLVETFAKAPGGVVMMFLDKKFTQQRMNILMKKVTKSQCYRMKLSGKSAADIKKSLREQINIKLSTCQKKIMTITDCAKVARELEGIAIDEDDPQCVQGEQLANNIKVKLAELEKSDKDSVLPLQSRKLWHEWAMHDKERHRHLNKGSKGIEQYNSMKEDDKLMIRQQQLSIAESPSPIMKAFLSTLIQLKGDARDYFLQWLQFILNDHSRKTLPKLFNQYQELRTQLLKLQREHISGREAAKEPLRLKLDQLNDELVHASFGLEHFLREVGQIYEAAVQQQNVSSELRQQVTRLPEVAAELLKSGYPIELMDGDASHVPLCWVTAVLDKLGQKLSDKQFFILSILGIQSSGKSTLLNTMFGLKFTVSAGRCTRGAFMQLLPVDQSLKEKTKCDYVLIIDTEGLRAPELSSQEIQTHDNELATFVIGLANITLINIFGETPGDMDDILQRAVHAFIRMEHVGLKPSCQFVHQNVGAVNCASRGMMGRVNFQEKLNTMTKAAAKEECLEGHYTMFSHVIKFNEEEDVWYFPGLWKGDPPMAPVNPGYSDGAQQLKSGLIDTIHGHCLLSDFKIRIQDVWEAILHENFIFSFKNTLEITAYNQLDAKYAQWSWEIQTRMLKLQETAKNRINSTDVEHLNDLKESLMSEISKVGMEILNMIYNEMKKFFEEDKQRDILAQWQSRTEIRLDEVRKEQEADARHQCKVRIRGKQDRGTADSMKQDQHNKLQTLVKTLVSDLEKKGQLLNDRQLEQLYEQKWLELMIILKSRLQDDHSKTQDIEGSLENSLKDLLATHHNLLNPKLTKEKLRERRSKSMKIVIKPDTHITANRVLKKLFKGESNVWAEVRSEHITAANMETESIFREVQTYLDGKRTQNFAQVFGHELLKILFESIANAQKKHPEFNFTPEYKVDVALLVCGYALPKFKEMEELFRKNNDPVVYLERQMKTPFLRLFKSQYYQTAQEKTAAYNLYDCFINPIEEALKGLLTQKIASEVKSSSNSFSTKKTLKARILSDLADKKCFEEYALYLKNVKQSIRTWLMRYTKQHCEKRRGTKSRFTELAEEELGRLVALISTAANKVTDSFRNADIQKWLAQFHSEVMTHLSLNLSEMQKVVGDLKDIKNFTEELCKKLGDLDMNQFPSLYDDMETWDNQPYDILMNVLSGCCEQCPFCKEQCELTDPNHSSKHSVSLHRSQCLGGWRREKSEKMVLETCTALVASNSNFWYRDNSEWKLHPYSRFQELPKYSSWTISPGNSEDDKLCIYWKWFLGEYTGKVAGLYHMKEETIPWKRVTREEAKLDLQKLYGT